MTKDTKKILQQHHVLTKPFTENGNNTNTRKKLLVLPYVCKTNEKKEMSPKRRKKGEREKERGNHRREGGEKKTNLGQLGLSWPISWNRHSHDYRQTAIERQPIQY